MSELKTELVPIIAPSGNAGRIKIGRVENLANKRILSVETRDNTAITTTPLGEPIVSPAVLKASFLTLEDKDKKESIDSLPLVSLSPTFNNGRKTMFGGMIANFENSYINVADATGLTSGDAFVLVVYYED